MASAGDGHITDMAIIIRAIITAGITATAAGDGGIGTGAIAGGGTTVGVIMAGGIMAAGATIAAITAVTATASRQSSFLEFIVPAAGGRPVSGRFFYAKGGTSAQLQRGSTFGMVRRDFR
jgi:hypothetical protein